MTHGLLDMYGNDDVLAHPQGLEPERLRRLATSTTGAPYQVTLVAIPIFMAGPAAQPRGRTLTLPNIMPSAGDLRMSIGNTLRHFAHGIEPGQ